MEEILRFDRDTTLAINGSDSVFWDNLMYVITHTESWTIVIIAILVIVFKNKSVKEGLIIFLCIGLMIFLADRLCSGVVKPLVARWRPTQDPQIMYMLDVVRGYRGGRFGFFSGHATNTFCMAMFFSLLFRYWKITLVMFLWAASTTFTRLYLGVHYFGDIVVGICVGCLFGVAFYKLMDYLTRNFDNRLISEQFTSSGYLKSDMNFLLSVIFFNYICLVIVSLTLGIE